MKLMNLFRDASKSLNDKYLRPSQKTYSMCMNVLSLHPESSTACDDVLSLLERCRRDTTTTADLQFYNVCLHTLAKCATHHPEAPRLVEKVFKEMISTTDLIPNTACFVSLLHAWANVIAIPTAISVTSTTTFAPSSDQDCNTAEASSDTTSPPLAAERVEAILDQMIRNYPELVDTICFNICIDAWGKQGHPEKAESVLWRLHNYHRLSTERGSNNEDTSSQKTNKQKVQPNHISFNSAINAWAKSGSIGDNGKHRDPQEAANRTEFLLEQMKLHGHTLTPETFGGAMEAYSKVPNPGVKVQTLLNELETLYSEGEISFSLPKVCYLMAIRAWGRTKSGGAERAEFLVQRMKKNSLQDDSSRSELEPCVIIYTALISAWAQSNAANAPDRALEVFREMYRKAKSGQKNVAPNTISLNAMLEAFCKHERIAEARKLLAQAKRQVRPDSRSYQIILKAYAESEASHAAENAQDLLRELENDYHHGGGTKPTVQMYSQLLVVCGNNWRNDGAFQAEEIFWKMFRQDDGISVQPDTTTLNCVLRAWSKSFEGGNAEKAETLLQRVQKESSEEILVDPISHLHLIYAWAHSRRKKAPMQAEAHLEEAKRLCMSGKNPHWKLKRAHFNGVILAWEKSNDTKATRHIQRLQGEMARFSK